jgi:hypothetical protein
VQPDSVGVRWEPAANGRGQSAGLHTLYHSTMTALWGMTPNAAIFFIEGGGQVGLLVSARRCRLLIKHMLPAGQLGPPS